MAIRQKEILELVPGEYYGRSHIEVEIEVEVEVEVEVGRG